MDTPAQLESLVKLLQESQPKASATAVSTSQGPVEPQASAQSGSVIRGFGEVVPGGGGGVSSSSTAPAPPHDPQSIWKEEEVLPLHEALSAPDGRKRPEFDFGYKQKVGSEDVFLGLSGTTESSIHCDTLVMRISLPGERLQDVELDCTDTRILVSAAHFKLSTFLPHKVFHRNSNAKWLADKSELYITLPLDKSDSLFAQ